MPITRWSTLIERNRRKSSRTDPMSLTTTREPLTRMQSCVLLHVAELLEPAVAVAALVRLLAGVDPDVLHELVVAGERFEALLALVRLNFVAGDHATRSDADPDTQTGQAAGDAAAGPRQCTRAQLPRVHLHRALVHEDLREELPGLVGTLYFSPSNGGWQIDSDRRIFPSRSPSLSHCRN